jgi:hypothetical protein
MLTPQELQTLVRELADTRILSVYLDTRVTDPAMRNAWRPALTSALRAARAGITEERERAEFDRAAALLGEPLPTPGGVWAAPGWVAFIAPDGVRYAADLPVRPPTIAAWREGPLAGPYLRALKQYRPVIVALVESRTARLYRYAWRQLESLGEMTTPVEEEPAGGKQGSSIPAPRAAVATEAANRRRVAAFQKLAAALGPRLAHLAGDDGWVLIGGTPEWARLAGEGVPRQLDGRVVVSTTLPHDAPESEIARAAKHAATELRAAYGRVLVDRLVERAGAQGRAAVGARTVQAALRAHAVDQLVISPHYLHEGGTVAEDMVRAALWQGADVDVLSADAGEHLDRSAGGVAARLRFAIGETAVAPDTIPGAGELPPAPSLAR